MFLWTNTFAKGVYTILASNKRYAHNDFIQQKMIAMQSGFADIKEDK